MSVIHRGIYVTRHQRIQPIDIVRGSQVGIELQLMDYDIPAGATAKAYARGRYAPNTYKADCTISGKTVAFTPPNGFFIPGLNRLQIEINGVIIPFSIDVNCESRVSEGGNPATPEKVEPLVERAEAAASAAEQTQEAVETIKADLEANNAMIPALKTQVADLHDGLHKYRRIITADIATVSVYADVTLYKGRQYTYTNHAGGSVNFSVKKNNGDFVTLRTFIKAGEVFNFICEEDYAGIRSYFDAPGSCVLEAVDDGVFAAIGDAEKIANNAIGALDVVTSEISADPADYEIGGWNVANGTTVNSTNRIRSKSPFIIDSTSTIKAAPGYKFYEACWDENGAYLGCWNGKALSFGAGNYHTTEDDVKQIIRSGAKTMRILFSRTDDADFSDTNEIANLMITKQRTAVNDLRDEIYEELSNPEKDYTSVSMFGTVGVIGDSFSSGGIYASEAGTTISNHYDISWPQILGRKTGVTFINYSSTGADVSRFLIGRRDFDPSWNIQKLESDPARDLYMIVMGINTEKSLTDSSVTVDTGTVADIKSDYNQNADTFCGHYGQMLDRIKEHAPRAKMILVAPVATTKVSAIKAIAGHYDIPYFNMNHDAFYSTDFYKQNRQSGHPIAATYAGMANAFDRQICKCIVDNIEYFGDYHVEGG